VVSALGSNTKLNNELPGLDEMTKILIDMADIEEPTGTTSNKIFIPRRSSVFTIAVLHLLLERAAAFEEQSVDA